MTSRRTLLWLLTFALFCPVALSAQEPPPLPLVKPQPVTMAELTRLKTEGVSVAEVSDYVFGNYKGDFPNPPHADGNPRKALIIFWKDFPYRFVFSHEASYCPWFELPTGAGFSYQFFEGNDGWAELLNQWGRQERNSFVDVLERGPKRVWVRWTYFGVNIEAGQPAYRATEDFWAYPNGLVLRRQTYETLLPGKRWGYAREPIELIGLSPVGKFWFDILARDRTTGESHALAVLDAFSAKRYDVYWKPKPGHVWYADFRRTGCDWTGLENSPGVVMAVPMVSGTPFCAFGDASGFRHDYTNLKEHTHAGIGWVGKSWDHWPIGWLNSQGHVMDESTLPFYPNHFSPMGMDFFPLSDEESERGMYYSLLGVAGENLDVVRSVARQWLEQGAGTANPDLVGNLPQVFGKTDR